MIYPVYRVQQYIYIHLLQRYLIIKYNSECEAKTRLLRLINTLLDLNNLCEIQKRTSIEICPDSCYMAPLIREIFDRNSTCIYHTKYANQLNILQIQAFMKTYLGHI